MKPIKPLRDLNNAEKLNETYDLRTVGKFWVQKSWERVAHMQTPFNLLEMIQNPETNWGAIPADDLLSSIQQLAIQIMYLRKTHTGESNTAKRVGLFEEANDLFYRVQVHMQSKEAEDNRTRNLGALAANLLSTQQFLRSSEDLPKSNWGGDQILAKWIFRDWFLEPEDPETKIPKSEKPLSRRKATYFRPSNGVLCKILNQPEEIKKALLNGQAINWNGSRFSEKLMWETGLNATDLLWLDDPEILAESIFKCGEKPRIRKFSEKRKYPTKAWTRPVTTSVRLLEILSALNGHCEENIFQYVLTCGFAEPDIVRTATIEVLQKNYPSEMKAAAAEFVGSTI
jgi:hypothetical protein